MTLQGPVPGSLFAGYSLEAGIGSGAIGVVFRAVAPDGSLVAVKILKGALSQDEIFRARWEHEVRAARELHHPHLVPVIDSGEYEGRKYLAMPFVEGVSLAARLSSDGPMDLAAVVRLTAELASGLDALHKQGLVHRDVKPSNILMSASGGAALTDFGLAKGRAYTLLTRPGEVMGTLDYVSPELLEGAAASPAADIYALGCVVFECIAGFPPFVGRGMVELALAHLEQAPSDPCEARNDVPAQMCSAVLHALAKSPAERPSTATAYANLLRVASGLGRHSC